MRNEEFKIQKSEIRNLNVEILHYVQDDKSHHSQFSIINFQLNK